jgi:hypothetical protein
VRSGCSVDHHQVQPVGVGLFDERTSDKQHFPVVHGDDASGVPARSTTWSGWDTGAWRMWPATT